MKRGAASVRGLAAMAFLATAGCAVLPSKSSSDLKAPVAERAMLAGAAEEVEKAPWPKPEPVSFIARITGGGGDDRVTRSDAVEAYLSGLNPAGARYPQLAAHARTNLLAARQLNVAARQAVDAPRLAMNDVALIEGAIQALREHREIYAAAAKELARLGEPVSDESIDAIRDEFREAVRMLGETADVLAERIEHDRSSTYASPDRTVRRKPSDL